MTLSPKNEPLGPEGWEEHSRYKGYCKGPKEGGTFKELKVIG